MWAFSPVKFCDRQYHGMRTFDFIQRKEQLGARDEENGEKPKIQITESVEIGNYFTVFLVGESLNLKPSLMVLTTARDCQVLALFFFPRRNPLSRRVIQVAWSPDLATPKVS